MNSDEGAYSTEKRLRKYWVIKSKKHLNVSNGY